MKSKKSILPLLLLLGSISSVVAEVSISNTYYSNLATVGNEVYLDGVDYSDSIDISSAGVSGSGTASSSELSSGNSTYIDSMQIPYINLGSSNKIASDDFGYHKTMSSGFCSIPSLSSDFNMGNGSAQSKVWNEFSSAQLDLKMVGCEYSGIQFAGELGIMMEGDGTRKSSYDGNSYVLQNLSLSNLGQSVETDMAFEELNTPPGAKPTELEWANYVASWSSDWAKSQVNFNVAYSGIYKADFNFTGKGDIPVQYAQLIDSKADTEGYDAWWINYLIIPEEVTLESNDTSD